MNSSPRPYLKVTRLASTQRGIEQHLLVLDVDALDRPDALREVEDLRLAERRRSCTSRGPLPDHRRVEALLDGRPDRERGREVVPGDGRGLPRPGRRPRRSRRTGGRPRTGRTRPRGPARRRSRPGRAALPLPTRPATANCSSPSFTPVRACGSSLEDRRAHGDERQNRGRKNHRNHAAGVHLQGNVRARAAVLAAADDTFRVLHHDAPVATLDEHNRGDDGDRHRQQEQDPDRTDIPTRHLIQDAQDGIRQHDDNAGEDDQ